MAKHEPPRVVAVANQKGGVGKTTTAVNLSAALADQGFRVLLIDLDPQGNASTAIGLESAVRQRGMYEVLSGECGLEDVAVLTPVPGLLLAPATVDLAAVEVEFSGIAEREYRLQEILAPLRSVDSPLPLDMVIIDCPPALGLLTVNALTAADSLLVPLQAEFLALEGLSYLLRTIEQVTRRLNPGLAIEGVLVTMVDRRNNLSTAVGDDVRRYLGDLVYATEIPRNVRISEAPSYGLPVLLYDRRCAGTEAYAQLAAEFLARLGTREPAEAPP
ncbi:MAG TPA: AAA family ATPase [Alphaproteobacteria bacterium]|nr:AAA family ATPase [Alphaproteobacteria bacterium]